MEHKDLYQLLGVTPKATSEEIKTAYRALARKYHPDLGESEKNEVIFKEITVAYRVLSDPEKRNEYNKEHGFDHYVALEEAEEIVEPKAPRGSSGVSLSSGMGDPGKVWESLKEKQGEHDLKVEHKVAMTPEEEDQEEVEDDEYVAPWGETPEAGAGRRKTGSLNIFGMFGSLGQKKRKTISKDELKKRLDEASQPLRPLDAAMPPEPAEEELEELEPEGPTFAPNTLQQERVFNFQISPLECALGTTRQLALPGSEGEEPRRITVDIPVGIRDGEVIEVTQGWDRAKVRISVAQDPFVHLEQNNIIYVLPITFGEAIRGFSWEVPVVSGSKKVKVPRCEKATERICLDGYGVADSETGIKGDLLVQPRVIPPDNLTDTLKAVAQVVDQHYLSSVREDLEQNGEASRLFQKQGDDTVLSLPVTFGEALLGVEVKVPASNGGLTVTTPSRWEVDNSIRFEGRGPERKDGGKGDLIVQPYVAVPESYSEDLKYAAEAIDQHYQRDVRAGIPRKLLKPSE